MSGDLLLRKHQKESKNNQQFAQPALHCTACLSYCGRVPGIMDDLK